MKIILSAAISLDGCLDDCSPERLRLSSPEDWEAVLRLRAGCDAILVGAETIRKDDPSLVIRDESLRRERLRCGMAVDLMKVTLSRSGRLNPEARFFSVGEGHKMVFVPAAAKLCAESCVSQCAEVVSAEAITARLIADTLAKRGIGTLMVEGGGQVLSMFLAEGMVDELRLAVAPFIVGDPNAPRWIVPGKYPWTPENRVRLERVEMLGDTSVLYYKNERNVCEKEKRDGR